MLFAFVAAAGAHVCISVTI